MSEKNPVPEKILKTHFILDEEIKAIGRKYPAETYSKNAFERECENNKKLKTHFRNFAVGTFGAILTTAFLVPFILLQNSVMTGATHDVAEVRRNFLITLAVLFFLVSAVCCFFASKTLKLARDDVKSRFMQDAPFPMKAGLSFEVCQKILNQKIPIHILVNNRLVSVSLRSIIFGNRPGAILFLLGGEEYYQALWKDGVLPKGPILIDRKYRDKIFGDFIQSQSGLNDGTGRRPLVTALLVKKHLENCIREMTAGGYWRNHRETAKKRKLIDISDLLANNWPIWEKFRKNIKTSLEMGKNKDSEFYHFATKLRVICSSDEDEIFNILTGYDQVAIKFFRELEAIPAPDLLPKSTQVKRFTADT